MGDQRQRGEAQNDEHSAGARAQTRSPAIERWPRAQYEEFMRRLHRAIYKPDADVPPTSWFSLGDPHQPLISPRNPEEVLQEHFAASWGWVVTHPVFRRLQDDPSFEAAWMAFQGQRRGPARWEAPKDRRAACQFVWTVALWLGVFPIAHRGRLFRRGPAAFDVRTREQGRRNVRRTRMLLRTGLEPTNVDEARALRELLERFERELAEPHRRKYMTAQRDEREWLRHFALWLRDSTGVLTPAVLTNTAAMIGYSVDPGTVKRIIRWVTGPR